MLYSCTIQSDIFGSIITRRQKEKKRKNLAFVAGILYEISTLETVVIWKRNIGALIHVSAVDHWNGISEKEKKPATAAAAAHIYSM